MKVVYCVLTFAAAVVLVGSAPALTEGLVPGYDNQQSYYRVVRSQYPQYISPCAAAAAAAASAPIPAIAPPYQVNVSPYQTYPLSRYGYAAPHYRSLEMDPETLSFSDMDHMMSEHVPMARYNYAAPASSVAVAPSSAAATTGSVFGIFPNANAGGCNVPLLFSCTPNVVAGHVVPTQSHYYAAGDSYRGVEPLAHHDAQESHEDPSPHEHLNAAHDSSAHATGHQ